MASHFDYEQSKHIAAQNYTFYGLLFALLRQADSFNLEKIEREWPEEVAEFRARYNAPGGYIGKEKPARGARRA